jgi:MarR family 2-MHQ and catechol resistance regulon transcriptional repressor
VPGAIVEHLGPRAQHELGRALFTSRPNITTVVDNLEKRDLVRRERDSADRRRVTVHLTERGRALIDEVLPGQVEAIVEEFSAISADEQDELGRLCKKLGRREVPAPIRAQRPDGTDASVEPMAAPGRR